MPRQTPGVQGVYVGMPVEVKARMEALAAANHRSIQAEIVHACERHLEVPPVVRVLVEAPPLPAAEAEHRPVRKGRPPKKGS